MSYLVNEKTQETFAYRLIRANTKPVVEKFGFRWAKFEKGCVQGKKVLKVGIEVGKVIKQGCVFAGFTQVACYVKLALIPCSIIRSVAFMISPHFTVDVQKLVESPQSRKNLAISFLTMTSLVAPFPPLFALREKDEIDELMQIETGFLKIFSLDCAVSEARGGKSKVSTHVRVLDLIKAVADVSMLFLTVSQAPQAIAVLGGISFGIGLYNLSQPGLVYLRDKIVRKPLPILIREDINPSSFVE